jgi:hypothetical protein
VVDAQGAGTIAARVVQAHELAAGRLAQRIALEQALGVAQRLRVVAALLEQRGEALERVQVQRAYALALRDQPLVVGTLDEVARVGVDRGGEPLGVVVRAREGSLELGDVEPVRGVGPPLERARRDVEEAIGVGQRAPQVVQDLAQVRPRLGLGGVGPEQEGEALARLRRVAVDEQVGEQRFRPRRLERGERDVAAAEAHLPEQTDVQHGRLHAADSLAGPAAVATRSAPQPRRATATT